MKVAELKMAAKTLSLAVCIFLSLVACTSADSRLERTSAPRVPVIYCTDLFHPHDDPDDHFDLATLYALPELDILAVVLDQGARQLEKPGRIPVSQMNAITGRQVPAVAGLADKLTAPADPGLDQPARFQEGVETILELLRSSGRPVDVVTTGSVRDLAAAYNREPELVKNKVRRGTAFIGEASSDFLEYNVQLDPNAWICLLRSGLNLYWVPCFDGQTEGGTLTNHGHASFWLAPHRDLLADCAPELLQY
ncbi:MAG TPA: nucleoside hydrolase, partial [Candidatus Glassbacteria bacterium]|nr:nucleoside hydrolase [Candidatus Glassbacteria bacterium]